MNFLWSDICSGKVILTTISEISVARRRDKVVQCSKKCSSDSTISVQNGQNRSVLLIPKSLPFSIMRSWLDRRILVRAIRLSICLESVEVFRNSNVSLKFCKRSQFAPIPIYIPKSFLVKGIHQPFKDHIKNSLPFRSAAYAWFI